MTLGMVPDVILKGPNMTATNLPSVPNGTALEIITPAVQGYLDRYHNALRKTAQAILEVAATVLEAKEQLPQPEFAQFLKEVGFDEKSSTYKKFVAIARKKELLERHVDQLPTAWTTIYQLAKLEPDQFEQVANSGQLSPLMGANQINAIIAGGNLPNSNRPVSDVFIATQELDAAQRVALHNEIAAVCERYGVAVRFGLSLIKLVNADTKEAA
mgnify:CR=1 FL=1